MKLQLSMVFPLAILLAGADACRDSSPAPQAGQRNLAKHPNAPAPSSQPASSRPVDSQQLASSRPVRSQPTAHQTSPVPPQPPTAGALHAKAASRKATLGIKECDAYVAKYLACAKGKVPSQHRRAVMRSFDQTLEAWRAAVERASAAKRQQMASACLSAARAAKRAMAAYNCAW